MFRAPKMYHGILYSTAKTPRGRSAALSGELGGVAERSAFGGLASSKVGLLKILKKSGPSEDFGTINQVRAVSSRINPSEQYYFLPLSSLLSNVSPF